MVPTTTTTTTDCPYCAARDYVEETLHTYGLKSREHAAALRYAYAWATRPAQQIHSPGCQHRSPERDTK